MFFNFNLIQTKFKKKKTLNLILLLLLLLSLFFRLGAKITRTFFMFFPNPRTIKPRTMQNFIQNPYPPPKPLEHEKIIKPKPT